MIAEIAAVAVSVVSVMVQQAQMRKTPALPFDFRTALSQLHEQLLDWNRHACATNRAVRSWVNAGMPTQGATADYVVSCSVSQASGAERVWAHLQPQPPRLPLGRLRPPHPELRKFLQFLDIYAPQLTVQFFAAADRRQEELDDLTATFRTLRRLRSHCTGTESISRYLDQLDASQREIENAARDLAAYIRQEFPLNPAN
ncbi:hypothetical protein AB0H86_09035 [Streptomyces sp. NPDC050997]|uniref:hypothetical protein n=1 Tax=Streptomyces sp. NPDC050997 TaxID=3155519 RepID=UPI0034333AE8